MTKKPDLTVYTNNDINIDITSDERGEVISFLEHALNDLKNESNPRPIKRAMLMIGFDNDDESGLLFRSEMINYEPEILIFDLEKLKLEILSR